MAGYRGGSGGGGGGGGAPTDAQYLTLAANGGLSDERVLTAGTGISLTDGGAGGALTVAATGGGGGGKILQVVHVPYTTLTTTNSLTYVDLMAGAITPTDATSTILIVVNLCISITSGGTGIFRVYDGAAAVSGGVKNAAHANQESGNIYLMSSVSTPHGYAPMYGFSTTIKDSPATTSAITYTVQFKCSASVDPITVNRNTRDGDNLVDSPGISTLTIYEIGA